LQNQAQLIEKRQEDRRYPWSCNITKCGKGWGAHNLCDTVPMNCTFFSFGIARHYGFDTDLANNFGCHGFAADPTVTHQSQLHPLITFHQIGAKMLNPNFEQKQGKKWWTISVPSLRRALDIPTLNVLKMDCEGCEYSLARDVLTEDPDFFKNHLDQITIETHVSREWLNTTETLYYYGMLFKLLKDAGFRLHETYIGSCSPDHEKTGCMKELQDMNYICGKYRSCHNYLFAKV